MTDTPKYDPITIAKEICSVQPMSAAANMFNPFTKKWERVGIDQPTGKWVHCIQHHEIWEWVESQPIHMWKHYDIPLEDESIKSLFGKNYIFTDEMEAWFMLRWAGE